MGPIVGVQFGEDVLDVAFHGFFRDGELSGDLSQMKLRMKREERWWAVAGSNRGPPACKAGALTS